MSEAELKSDTQAHEVTQLLISWSDGDQNALDELMPLIYRTLQKIAHSHLNRERSSHTLQTTALVHEAYLKMINQHSVDWKKPVAFLCACFAGHAADPD